MNENEKMNEQTTTVEKKNFKETAKEFGGKAKDFGKKIVKVVVPAAAGAGVMAILDRTIFKKKDAESACDYATSETYTSITENDLPGNDA